MSAFWTRAGLYRKVEYKNEADLEDAIIQVQKDLFGANRYYLDVKKKIGSKGSIQNVPDGYLLDHSGSKPRLYVVENELQAHDPLRHIAVQILQFSLSFENERLGVQKVLLHALQIQQDVKKAAETYATERGFRNLDHLLQHLVFESPFSALVIIDSMPEELEDVLSQKFRFGVEVLELGRYENAAGEHVYGFEPFLADVTGGPMLSPEDNVKRPAIDEIDTVVVPAREEGFQEVFLGQNRWYAVRIHDAVRSQIKYIAAYQVAPIAAITYIAPVKSIEPWKDSGKVVLNFSEPAKPIGPLRRVKGGKVYPLISLRYTTRERLLKAKDLEDAFSGGGGLASAAQATG
ncbi:MAG: hypothetical protein WBM04_00760 [Candidatus Korobacteraceae bacterium]